MPLCLWPLSLFLHLTKQVQSNVSSYTLLSSIYLPFLRLETKLLNCLRICFTLVSRPYLSFLVKVGIISLGGNVGKLICTCSNMNMIILCRHFLLVTLLSFLFFSSLSFWCIFFILSLSLSLFVFSFHYLLFLSFFFSSSSPFLFLTGLNFLLVFIFLTSLDFIFSNIFTFYPSLF